jgi:hypothetical protein
VIYLKDKDVKKSLKKRIQKLRLTAALVARAAAVAWIQKMAQKITQYHGVPLESLKVEATKGW